VVEVEEEAGEETEEEDEEEVVIVGVAVVPFRLFVEEKDLGGDSIEVLDNLLLIVVATIALLSSKLVAIGVVGVVGEFGVKGKVSTRGEDDIEFVFTEIRLDGGGGGIVGRGPIGFIFAGSYIKLLIALCTCS